MPSWEDILDNPEQYLILNDKVEAVTELRDEVRLRCDSELRIYREQSV